MVQGSPVVTLEKELNFDTEESRDANDLNKLLQLNEEPNFDRETHKLDFKLEETSILNRHTVVKEDILNLPRPAPKQIARSLVENLKTLDEPISINGTKIYEPFFVNIWECLRKQPLTTIRLKIQRKEALASMIDKCEEMLGQSMHEYSTNPSAKLRALQFRLIRIAYKKNIYPLVLRLQETIYEYNDKVVILDEARKAWQNTKNYTRRVNGDKSLVSKVRQNKAFEMRRQMNIDQYGHKRSVSLSRSKYEERELECELSYKLTKDITQKLITK